MSTGRFLDRWSQRKRAAPEREAGDERAEDAMPASTRGAGAGDPSPVADPPDLPPLDSLRPDTPLTPFFQPGVPPDMKNAALRTMWLLDPAIRDHVDFAVDYAWDWNVPGGVPGHGGALAPAQVARALGRLTAPAGPPAAAEAPDPAAPDPAVPKLAAPDPVPEPPSTADHAAQPIAEGPGPAASPPRRRHGGAVPA